MRLSKTTNHAIRILIDCAKAKAPLVKVAEISERLDITQQNTFKIVHLLSRAGFLEAVRGRNGGVKLAISADEIRIGQVVRAIETAIATTEPTQKESGKQLGVIVGDALDAFTSVLDEHTIADMALQAQRRGKNGKALAKKKSAKTSARGKSSRSKPMLAKSTRTRRRSASL